MLRSILLTQHPVKLEQITHCRGNNVLVGELSPKWETAEVWISRRICRRFERGVDVHLSSCISLCVQERGQQQADKDLPSGREVRLLRPADVQLSGGAHQPLQTRVSGSVQHQTGCQTHVPHLSLPAGQQTEPLTQQTPNKMLSVPLFWLYLKETSVALQPESLCLKIILFLSAVNIQHILTAL